MVKNHWLKKRIESNIIGFLNSMLFEPFDMEFINKFHKKFDGHKTMIDSVGDVVYFSVDGVSVRVVRIC